MNILRFPGNIAEKTCRTEESNVLSLLQVRDKYCFAKSIWRPKSDFDLNVGHSCSEVRPIYSLTQIIA